MEFGEIAVNFIIILNLITVIIQTSFAALLMMIITIIHFIILIVSLASGLVIFTKLRLISWARSVSRLLIYTLVDHI